MTDQSRRTSFNGTGIYFRASMATTSPSCFSGTGGTDTKVMSDEERGSAAPQANVVVLASRKTSLIASIVFSADRETARPTSMPAYGPRASSP